MALIKKMADFKINLAVIGVGVAMVAPCTKFDGGRNCDVMYDWRRGGDGGTLYQTSPRQKL